MKIRIPELLIVAGTGRNSGKTTLVCDIIRRISVLQQIVAIKVTPHFHENYITGKVITDKGGLFIMEENLASSDKDSSRMLAAGAWKVYFVMAMDDKVKEAFLTILSLFPEKTPVICESESLRHYLEPGLFLMMNRSDRSVIKPGATVLQQLADRWITFDTENLDFDPETVKYIANEWKILPKD